VGLIPGSGRCPGVGNGNPLWYSAWKIREQRKPGGLHSKGLRRVVRDWALTHLFPWIVYSLNSLSFCFSDKNLIFPPRIFSLDIRFLVIVFSLYCLTAYILSDKMSVNILIYFFLPCMSFFMWFFLMFSLMLFPPQFNHNSLCVIFFMFILLGCHWISWIWRNRILQIWKIPGHLLFKYFSCSPFEL